VNISVDHVYNLLPALYRERDEASGGALRQYLEVLTDEFAVVADGIDQLYDDLFVETAAPWVLPYLADLIGLRGLPGAATSGLTHRAEVANTIAYRRRKGTAAVLEQVARDTTGWPARAVEYFELVATCQHVNHVRPRNQVTVSVRGASRLEWLGTAFERGNAPGEADLVHLPEMRRIATRHGRYDLPNVGIVLWRLQPYPVTDAPTRPLAADPQHRFLLDPLGAPVQLFTLPVTESEITHLAEPIGVPLPIGRRLMDGAPASYYGPGLSVSLATAAGPVPLSAVKVCDLRDVPDGSGDWAHGPVPAGQVRLDPALGRVAFGDALAAPPTVSYHRGFSADLGGGEYDRVDTFTVTEAAVITVAATGGADHVRIADAIAALATSGGVVEIVDNATYAEPLALVAAGVAVELRAADRRRPVVILTGDLSVAVADGGEVSLNGLVLAGGAVRVAGDGRLVVRHSTLVPGVELLADGAPAQPGEPSLHVTSGQTSVSIERSIVGGIRSHPDADVALRDCLVDAGVDGIAYASTDVAPAGGGPIVVDECTILGRLHARILDRLSNAIVLAGIPAGEEAAWPGPVLADQRQRGCVRFSYLPAGSRTPRRYRCLPQSELDAAELRPVLTSARFGLPGYGQLDRRTPDAVRTGAEDEGEMGVFHHLQQPHREAYLRARLDDYLRFGLEAGLFFAT
jgi:hypothetical protein